MLANPGWIRLDLAGSGPCTVTRRRFVGTRRGRSHLLLPIFFWFSYILLGIPLSPSCTMGSMNGSAFQISQNAAKQARANGPVLTLIHGTADDAPTPSSEADFAHPAQEDFTPYGTPDHAVLHAVTVSEPGSPAVRHASRGSDSPDARGTADLGSGPISPHAELVERLSSFLASIDEPSNPDARIYQIR